jgi:hypothetical protein
MQRLVAKRYGWGGWTDDPWGSSRKFAEWEEAIKDDELAIWAVNETPAGRFYLALGHLLLVSQLDYSKMAPKELVLYEGIGAENFLFIKGYSGWERFNYPKQPLPVGYINEKIIKLYTRHPFAMYHEVIFSIYRWFRVSDELTKRIAEHPELKGLLAYASAKHPEISKLTRALTPKNFHLDDEDEGWDKFEKAMGEQLKRVTRKYNDVFPLSSEVEGNVLKESDLAGQEGLFEAACDWMEKDFITAGLEGRLVPSVLRGVKNDFIDAARKENPLFARLWQQAKTRYQPKTDKEKIKLRERVQDLCDKIQCREPLATSDSDLFNSLINSSQEKAELIHLAMPLSLDRQIETADGDNYCLGDTVEDRQAQFVENIKEPIDLARLGFDVDQLTPKEIALLNELNDMATKGYNRDSKQGLSFREYWGRDYDRKIKMLQRLNAKRQRL